MNHVRDLVLHLISEGVSTEHVDAVMAMICRTLGVEMVGHLSPHSVGRIMVEGGVIGDLHIAEKLIEVKGI